MAWKFLRETANFLLGCSIYSALIDWRVRISDTLQRLSTAWRYEQPAAQQKIPDGFIHFKVVNQKAEDRVGFTVFELIYFLKSICQVVNVG